LKGENPNKPVWKKFIQSSLLEGLEVAKIKYLIDYFEDDEADNFISEMKKIPQI
jgi:hypothetical protein